VGLGEVVGKDYKGSFRRHVFHNDMVIELIENLPVFVGCQRASLPVDEILDHMEDRA
jgi:hypothetical protein